MPEQFVERSSPRRRLWAARPRTSRRPQPRLCAVHQRVGSPDSDRQSNATQCPSGASPSAVQAGLDCVHRPPQIRRSTWRWDERRVRRPNRLGRSWLSAIYPFGPSSTASLPAIYAAARRSGNINSGSTKDQIVADHGGVRSERTEKLHDRSQHTARPNYRKPRIEPVFDNEAFGYGDLKNAGRWSAHEVLKPVSDVHPTPLVFIPIAVRSPLACMLSSL